jgi:hypothetical protein
MDIQDRQAGQDRHEPEPGQGVMRDSTGWFYVLVGAFIIIAAVFAGGLLLGPTDQSTIAFNVQPDGVRSGVGNTPAPPPPARPN